MGKPKLHIDVETFSSVDIRSAGAHKYAESIDFEILLVAYAFGSDPVQLVDLASGENLPEDFLAALKDPETVKVAHNAAFERIAFSAFGIDTPVDVWECTAIKSAYCGLPLGLGPVSEILGLEKGKKATGKALIKLFCMPCRPTKKNGGRKRNLPEHLPEKWEEFKEYCVYDVEAERGIDSFFGRYILPQEEVLNYRLDQKINDRGVLLDLELAQKAVLLDEANKAILIAQAIELTGVANPNSPAQLKKWLSEQTGKEIKSLDKDSVKDLLASLGAGPVREVLKLRQKLGKTSTKKYLAMALSACRDRRARGLLQFYGAGRTGRWAGRRIQLQNLIRNKLKLLDFARNCVLEHAYEEFALIFDKVSDTLAQLVRTAIKAPEGHLFAVADFSSIEARVIAWLAGEEWRLEVFRTHAKIYEASAASMFDVPIESIGKNSELRAKGKVAELALGYQGGVGALKTMGGEAMGLTESEMKEIVHKWRAASPAIVKLWRQVEAAAKRTLRTGRVVSMKGGLLKFKYDGTTLRIKLPSGRCLFYFKPKFGQGKFGEVIKYQGSDQKTRRWTYLETYGGKLVENIVQAIARDLLAFSLRQLDSEGFRLVMHVHDEGIAEIPIEDAEQRLEQMCDIMAIGPDWSEGLLLNADGYLTPYYKKD